MRRTGLALVTAAMVGGCASRGTTSAEAATSDSGTTHGEWIRIAHGADSIRAYLAFPERSDRAPAIIVIHENQGLTQWEPTVADRLAKAGYVAVAPDLLSSRFGATPATGDSARRLIGQLVPDAVGADLDAVFAHLNGLPSVRTGDIATIGFCWGGGQSFAYATRNPRLKAAVVCYGPAPDSAALARIQAPVLGVYGENDARINAALPDVERRMRALGKSFDKEIFDSTGHGFLKPGRQGSDGPQVERAWSRILRFYRETLGG